MEEGASQWVEGFEIPLTPEEEQEAQEELYDILAIIGDDFLSYHEKDSYNTEIPEDKLEEKVKILAETELELDFTLFHLLQIPLLQRNLLKQ